MRRNEETMKLLALCLFLLTSTVWGETHFTRSESQSLKFKKTDYSFIISWVTGPARSGSKFIMKTWKEDVGTMNGPYQDLSKNLHVFLWMPSMGHGSAPVKLKRLDNGEYEVSEIQFIMGGKWEIRFQLKDGAQVYDETAIGLSI